MPAGGMALGMMPDISSVLNIFDVPMESGDVAVLYSDGIRRRGKARARALWNAESKTRCSGIGSDLPTAEALKNALFADVKEYCGKYKQMDDMTVLVFKKS